MTVMEVAPEFGYVVLVFVLSIFLLQGLGVNVVRARKKYEVRVGHIDLYIFFIKNV